MSRSRKARRRDERARSRRRPPTEKMSGLFRIGVAVVGVICVFGGIALLSAGGPGTAARLGRVGGILIVIGVVACIAAALGRL